MVGIKDIKEKIIDNKMNCNTSDHD